MYCLRSGLIPQATTPFASRARVADHVIDDVGARDLFPGESNFVRRCAGCRSHPTHVARPAHPARRLPPCRVVSLFAAPGGAAWSRHSPSLLVPSPERAPTPTFENYFPPSESAEAGRFSRSPSLIALQMPLHMKNGGKKVLCYSGARFRSKIILPCMLL